MNRRKKIVFQTNAPWLKTGLAENGRTLMKYLQKTGKYDLIYYCTQTSIMDGNLNRMPYKSIGCIPADNREVQELQRDPGRWRDVCYGAYYIDKIINDEKPDIWLGSDDIWAFGGQYYNSEWFKKINSILHITIDSVPILNQAYEQARATSNFFSWSKFAIDEMGRHGQKIDSIYGAVETTKFKQITRQEKRDLRKKFGIDEKTTLFIYLGRNQLRKEFGNVLQAFAMLKKESPNANVKLLFHTSFSEKHSGWDIPILTKYFGINNDDVLCTMVCKNCGQWEVKPYNGEDTDCRFCGAKKSQVSTNIVHGVPDDELHQVYGICDASLSCATSGAQEITGTNSLLCGLPLACTNYSFGEDFCKQPFVYPIKWHSRHEAGTNFIKATNDIQSIKEFMQKIMASQPKDREAICEAGLAWAAQEFSIETIGAKWEKVFDAMPAKDWSSITLSPPQKNPNYPTPNIEDNAAWLKDLYKNILLMDVGNDDSGLLHWLEQIKNGMPRDRIHAYFISVANDENRKHAPPQDFGVMFESNGRKRILLVMKESSGDIYIITALFKNLKGLYPDADLYVATDPKFHEILMGNEYVFRILPYLPVMEQEMVMMHYVDYYYFPPLPTQKQLAYLTKDKIGLSLQ